MVEMKDVVAKLATLTEQGQVPWKTTVNETTFVATFGKMSVLISTNAPVVGTPFLSNKSYQLSVLDEKGNEIDFDIASGGPPIVGVSRPVLVDLYNSAKRSALGVDQRLEELLNEMDRVSNS